MFYCLADQAASENLLLLKMVVLCFHEQHFVSSFSLLFNICAKKLNNIKVRKKLGFFTFFWKFELPLRVLSFINQLYIKLGQFPLFWPDSSIQRKSRVSLSNYLQKSFHSLLVPIVLRFQNDNLLWEHLLIYHSFWYVAVAALKSHKYSRYKRFLFALTRKKITNFETMSIFVISKAKIIPTIST